MTAENTNKLEFESAITALSEYGFAKARIKRTLKDILRVYNGNEAWPLLKENGYEVVLERLLSDDGLRQRTSQRKDVVQTPGQGGHNKEKKKSNLDPVAGNEGGLDCRHSVADISSNSSFLITPARDVENSDTHLQRKDVMLTPGQGGHNKEKKKTNLDPDAGNGEGLDCRHPVADISSNSSFLVTPTRDVENSDIHSHQRNSWTRNGSFPSPAWLEISNASKKGAQQNYSHLHALMQRLDKDCFKQADNSCIDCSEVKPVKDEKIECIGECLQERHANSCEVKAVKIEKIDCREEGQVRTWSSQQESNPARFKIQKLSDVPHTRHAETCNITGCVQQESNPPILKTQKLAEVRHTDHAETSNMSTNPQHESNSAMLKTQKSADVLHTQHGISHVALDTTGIERSPKEDYIGNGLKKRKRVLASEEHCEKTSEPVAAVQTKRPRRQSTGQRTNNLQSTLHATERLDIARMSACKLTRRRDGGPNPMFARLQKLKQAGAEASVSQNNRESSVLNESQGGAAQSDLHTGTYTSQAPNLPSREEETLDETPSQDSPRLPPGFWEPPVCADPPESPRLPPGFSEPCGSRASQEPNLPGREKEYQDPIPSDESPRLPPGFSEPCDPVSSPESLRLPPGFWEWPDSEPAHHDLHFEACKSNAAGRSSSRLSPDLPPGFWKSSDREAGCSSPSGKYMARKPASLWVSSSREVSAKDSQEGNKCSKEFAKSKGTPLKQVFIANIPEGYEGAEQKLYSLVREVLEGFKSVPISATLPRKIQVTEDHAFVEFYCEAMAGIFMDAYHANASVLRIDGEQLVAARSLHRMKMDIQLRRAVANRLRGQVLDPRNVFYLGNVPSEWQNEERLSSHISTLLEGTAHTLTSKTLSVYTIPDFSDVYVHIPSSLLAETFFLRCLSDKEHLEEISTSLFVCRNSTFLPRAARVSLGS